MTKVDIISGFLGAGKTTLIKKLINDCFKNQNVVIIENEFGEIGIDGGFLQDAGINVTEMNSGCICCSLVGDFGRALEKVLQEYSPERIIIEPSGVGKLSDVIAAIENLKSEKLILNSFSTVVDAKKCKIYHKNFGEFFNNQIQSAKTVILSHTNNISEEKIEQCINTVKELNANALVITTDWDELSGHQILNAMENGAEDVTKIIHEHHHHDEHCDCGCHEHGHHHHDEHCDCHEHGHHHHDEHCDCGCHEHEHHHDEHCDCGCHEHEHHHHADDIFESYGIQTNKEYSKKQLEEILIKLSEDTQFSKILRAKGIVKCNCGDWIHFDYIPGEYEIRCGAADVTGKICIIGVDLNKELLEKLFK